MKNITLSLLLSVFGFSCIAQDCEYVLPVYDTWVEQDVFIGEVELFDGSIDTLYMDIYKPIGDENESRPLILWYYGGGFSGGQKEGMADVCQLYASRGYVAVAANYRLGFETPLLLTYPYAYDSSELIRANYRAMQDAKGTIRYLKSRAAIDSSDVNNFFAGGFSAGGFTALAAAFWDKESEKPLDCGEIDPANNSIPASPRPDLGSIDGTLHLGLGDSDLKGVVNVFGGVIMPEILDEVGSAVYMYHQTDDPIVHCEQMRPYWGIGLGIPSGYPLVDGSCEIYDHLTGLGYTSDQLAFYEHPGNAHTIHDAVLIDLEIAEFLETLICTVVSQQEPEASFSLTSYPNPFEDQIFIELEGVQLTDGQVMIYDVQGNLKHTEIINSDLHAIDLDSSLPSGVYFLKVQIGDQHRIERLIKSN